MPNFFAKYPVEGGVSVVTTINGLSGALTLVGAGGITVTSSGGNTLTITDTNPAGANTALSNLTSPTAINQSLLPDETLTFNLGSSTEIWSELSVEDIMVFRSSTLVAIDLKNSFMQDSSGVPSIDWSNRLLLDNTTATQLSWGTSGIAISTALTTPAFQLTTSPTSGYILTSDPSGNGTWQNGALTFVPQSEVGAANGVASLDSSGKVPVAQLPSAVFVYQGTWNPSTNTPTLIDGTGTAGYVYWVNTAYAGPVVGLSNPSMINFQIGDLVLYNGTQWELSTPAAGVSSVNGMQGAVTVNAINQLSGDGTTSAASGSQSEALTLATVNSNVGSFTNANITINAKGLVTAASNGSVSGFANTALSNLTSPTAVNQNLLPGTNNTFDIGGVGTAWNNVYANDLFAPTWFNLAGTQGAGWVGANLIPEVSGQSLGTSSNPWGGLVTTAIQITTSPTAGYALISDASGNGTWQPLSVSSVTGTLDVANGGTGDTSFVANQVILGGTTTTGALQQVAGGTTGYILTSTGATSAPTWQVAPASSPLTTKGDIYTYTTTNARQPVPADYGDLIADSTQATGWRDATYTQTQGKPGKNYIQYADFENNATTGWTLGTIGTLTNGLPTGSPTFGSGASGNLSISATSSSIEGAYSLSYASSAATTAGNMVATSSYAIDAEDQAKVLTVKFYYNVPSGAANCNFSGTSSNSFAWAIYDVTNSSWLTSSGNFNLIQSSGCGYVTGTCQTNSNTANIRLVVYNANVTAGAATLTLDGFYVGPQTAPSGPAMTDMVPYTPTIAGFGTVTNLIAASGRLGDKLIVSGSFTSGSSTATTATISLGYNGGNNNVTTDNSGKLSAVLQAAGTASVTGEAANNVIVLVAQGQTNVNLGLSNTSFSSGAAANGNAIATSGNVVSFNFIVPIAGWSSNSSMSADTDTRVVATRYTDTSGTSYTASTPKTFVATTQDYDTTGSYASNIYTVPVTGKYKVSIAINGGSVAYSAGSLQYAVLQKNGSDFEYIAMINTQASATYRIALVGSGEINCVAGDTLNVNLTFSVTNSLDTTAGRNWISFERLSGPAVITATESVAVYATSQNPTGTLTNSLNVAKFGTITKDTHSGYSTSTGLYTVPVSGWYQCCCTLSMSDASVNVGQGAAVTLRQNSTDIAMGSYLDSSTSVTSVRVSVNQATYCNTGDTLGFYVYNNGTTPTYADSFGLGILSSFSITRTGKGN